MTRWADLFGTPHPPIWTPPNGHQLPARGHTQAFYAGLPDWLPATVGHHPPALLPFADALLFVADHPGWRLRKIGQDWRVISP